MHQGCKLLVAHSQMRPNVVCGLPEIKNWSPTWRLESKAKWSIICISYTYMWIYEQCSKLVQVIIYISLQYGQQKCWQRALRRKIRRQLVFCILTVSAFLDLKINSISLWARRFSCGLLKYLIKEPTWPLQNFTKLHPCASLLFFPGPVAEVDEVIDFDDDDDFGQSEEKTETEKSTIETGTWCLLFAVVTFIVACLGFNCLISLKLNPFKVSHGNSRLKA